MKQTKQKQKKKTRGRGLLLLQHYHIALLSYAVKAIAPTFHLLREPRPPSVQKPSRYHMLQNPLESPCGPKTPWCTKY